MQSNMRLLRRTVDAVPWKIFLQSNDLLKGSRRCFTNILNIHRNEKHSKFLLKTFIGNNLVTEPLGLCELNHCYFAQKCKFHASSICNNELRRQSTNEKTVTNGDRIKKRPTMLKDFYDQLVQNNRAVDHSDWNELDNMCRWDSKYKGMLQFWPVQFMSIIGNNSVVSEETKTLSSSLLKFVQETDHLEHVTKNKMFWLMYVLCLSNQSDKKDEVFQLLEEKWGTPDILDSTTATTFIQIYSNTSRWKEALRFVDMARETSEKAVIHQPLFVPALKNKDYDTVFQLLQIYVDRSDGYESMRDDNVMTGLLKAAFEDVGFMEDLFGFLRDNQWFISKEVADVINQYFTSDSWEGTFSRIGKHGKCENCGYQFSTIPALSGKDFSNMRETFLQKTLVRDNIFFNTNPQEFTRFKGFLEEAGRFDIVVDALNVSYGRQRISPEQRSSMLLGVVRYLFEVKGLRILVLGREHMKDWKKKSNMKKIETMASCFYTQNISADDPFMLYAALNSGQKTLILTNDYLRKESFLLGPDLRQVFQLWQLTNQVNIEVVNRNTGKFSIIWPDSHDIKVQYDNGRFHIPYQDGPKDRAMLRIPRTVMCGKTADKTAIKSEKKTEITSVDSEKTSVNIEKTSVDNEKTSVDRGKETEKTFVNTGKKTTKISGEREKRTAKISVNRFFD